MKRRLPPGSSSMSRWSSKAIEERHQRWAESLDPKSVFDELVTLFIAAKAKRQVMMVTHNANLVINVDADQIIVAAAGPHPSGGLPPISYKAGGLESAAIRKAVCDILEGGEAAFRERARRLRVRLER